MKTRTNIFLLAAILVCRADGVTAADASRTPAANGLDLATAPTDSSKPSVLEDLGSVVINGRTNRIVRVLSADPVSVFVIYESEANGPGGCKIPRKELPPQLQVKYPYDEAKAAEYKNQQAERAAEQAALSLQQSERVRAAAREALRLKELEILAQIDSWNKRDVELQKEKNILNSLPPGNGRRIRARHISDEQQAIRQHIAQLQQQVEQIRARIVATP